MSTYIYKKLYNCRAQGDEKLLIGLINQIRSSKQLPTKVIFNYHDTLLFILSRYSNPQLTKLAHDQLVRISKVVAKITKIKPNFLKGSGVCSTCREDSFTYDLLKVISEKLGRNANFNLDDVILTEKFDQFLQECLLTSERDAVIYEHASTADLISILSRKKSNSLSWFVREFGKINLPGRTRDFITSQLDLWIKWHLTKDGWSRSFLRFPNSNQKKKLLDVCRGTLAVRGRETDTVIYTRPSRVSLFNGRNKTQIALFEMNPDRRLPLESYVGFVAAVNKVPVAYGGAWILGYRSEIGVNIFEEFRGGKSKDLFKQIMNVYKKVYGVKTFIVHQSQFGEGNEEAIKSGAFWFYYRLGFRPDCKKLLKLSSIEALKKLKNSKYRTPKKVLLKLATKQLILEEGTKTESNDKYLITQKIGYLLLKVIGEKFGGDKDKARQYAQKIWHKLDTQNRHKFSDFALLILLLPNINRWTKSQRKSLKKIIALKQHGTEKSFNFHFQKHSRLKAELIKQIQKLNF